MGRKKIIDSDKRYARLHIRLTEAEQLRLREDAHERGLTVSDLVRQVSLNVKPLIRRADPERAELIKRLGELGKIGGLLNQIAHELHRERITGQPKTIPDQALSDALAGLQVIGDRITQILMGGHQG